MNKVKGKRIEHGWSSDDDYDRKDLLFPCDGFGEYFFEPVKAVQDNEGKK